MSKETDRLSVLGICHNHGLASIGDKVFINFHTYDSRSVMPNGWAVTRIGRNLSPAWYDQGSKRFSGKKRDMGVLMNALTFASTLGGQTKWVLSPFGGYISKATADKNGIKYDKKKVISTIPKSKRG